MGNEMHRREKDNFLKNFIKSLSGKIEMMNEIYFIPLKKSENLHLHRGKDSVRDYESYTETITLTSLDQKMILRVLKEKETDKIEVFLISSEEFLQRYVFFKINGIEEEFITDSKGKASIESYNMDLSKIRVRVFPPVAVFRFSIREEEELSLQPLFVTDKKFESKINVTLNIFNKKRNLKIEIPFFREASGSEKVVLIVNEKVLINIPYNGISIFEDVEECEEFQLNLYQ